MSSRWRTPASRADTSAAGGQKIAQLEEALRQAGVVNTQLKKQLAAQTAPEPPLPKSRLHRALTSTLGLVRSVLLFDRVIGKMVMRRLDKGSPQVIVVFGLGAMVLSGVKIWMLLQLATTLASTIGRLEIPCSACRRAAGFIK